MAKQFRNWIKIFDSGYEEEEQVKPGFTNYQPRGFNFKKIINIQRFGKWEKLEISHTNYLKNSQDRQISKN